MLRAQGPGELPRRGLRALGVRVRPGGVEAKVAGAQDAGERHGDGGGLQALRVGGPVPCVATVGRLRLVWEPHCNDCMLKRIQWEPH